MAYTFIKTKDPENAFDYSEVKLTIFSEDTSIGVIIDEFQNFLIACGYHPETVENAFTEGS